MVKMRAIPEWFRAAWRYYRCWHFLKVDVCFFFSYLFRNPFTISKRFLEKRGESDPFRYGETPLTTLAKISEECGIQHDDTVIDLGCGRGKTVFWWRCFLGCRVVGVDMIPEYIEKAKKIKSLTKLEGVDFFCQDITEVDLCDVTVVYLYGTSLDDAVIRALVQRFESLKSGIRIITTSYPLTTYTTSSKISLEKTFTVDYPWGSTNVYLHVISGDGVVDDE